MAVDRDVGPLSFTGSSLWRSLADTGSVALALTNLPHHPDGVSILFSLLFFRLAVASNRFHLQPNFHVARTRISV